MAANVFISYSHKDEKLKKELLNHLAPLKQEGLVAVWHDRLLRPGEHLDNAIQNELSAADIILLLVSSDFLASGYCVENEMAKSFERARAGGPRVVVIVLRPCQWGGVPVAGGVLGDFVALPLDARPVIKFTHRDDAWSQIVGAVATYLREAAGSESEADHSLPTVVPDLLCPTPQPLKPDRGFSVYCRFDYASLTKDAEAVVAAAARYAAGREGHVVVTGHTDAAEDSLPLSRARALITAEALTKLSIARERLQVGWSGSEMPAVKSRPDEREPLNRRVTIDIE